MDWIKTQELTDIVDFSWWGFSDYPEELMLFDSANLGEMISIWLSVEGTRLSAEGWFDDFTKSIWELDSNNYDALHSGSKFSDLGPFGHSYGNLFKLNYGDGRIRTGLIECKSKPH